MEKRQILSFCFLVTRLKAFIYAGSPVCSTNISVELHKVVSPLTRLSFHFSLSNFPMGRGSEGLGMKLAQPYTLLSLVPRLLFTEWENSLVNCLYRFGSNILKSL